jgi:hypothetical protein
MSVVITATGVTVVAESVKSIVVISPFSVSGAVGVTDHGGLSGLGDDDHPQYHNNSRGDERYYTKDQINDLIPYDKTIVYPAAPVPQSFGHFITTTSFDPVGTGIKHPIKANKVYSFSIMVSAAGSSGTDGLFFSLLSTNSSKHNIAGRGPNSTLLNVISYYSNFASVDMPFKIGPFCKSSSLLAPVHISGVVYSGEEDGELELGFSSTLDERLVKVSIVIFNLREV